MRIRVRRQSAGTALALGWVAKAVVGTLAWTWTLAWLVVAPVVTDAWAPQSPRWPGIVVRGSSASASATSHPITRHMAQGHGPDGDGAPRATATTTVAVVSSVDEEEENAVAASSSSTWEEIGRALELLGITWNEWILPLGQGLLPPDNPPPSNWDDFWELSLSSAGATTASAATAASSHDEILVAEQFTRYLETLGATYVKFGQALSSRPDIVPRSLAVALSKLQDDMEVRDDSVGLATAAGVRELLRRDYTALMQQQQQTQQPSAFADSNELEEFLASLSEEPVAAASIGVVYSGVLPSQKGDPAAGQKVAIKIQRPNVRETVQRDAKLLRRAAEIIESIPSANNDDKTDRLIRTNVTGAVDEFMTRLEEELDYRREANNLELFGKLYSHQRDPGNGFDRSLDELVNLPSDKGINVVVPKVYKHLCTETVLVMEWIDGIKLVDLQANPVQDQNKNQTERAAKETKETLELIQQGIDCTLSQLLETGILHADPHGGNLLKVAVGNDDETSGNKKALEASQYRLGYIDFGMLSTIPSTVQDGLICAVCQLIFANNVTAVSELFGELQLLPQDILEDPVESAALAQELTMAVGKVLVFPSDEENARLEAQGKPKIPSLRFDKLLDVLVRLVPRFRFQLPPYFLNNARALATLEGMAREVDPNFNILRNLYPYAIRRIFSNPTHSPVVEGTLRSLIQTPSTGRIDIGKLRKLLKDASNYSGYSRLKVLRDIARSRRGPALVGRLAREQTVGRMRMRILRTRRRNKGPRKDRHNRKKRRRRRWLLLIDKLAEYSRL